MRDLTRSMLIWGLAFGLASGYIAGVVFGYPWDRAPWSAAGAAIGLVAGLVLDSLALRAVLRRLPTSMWHCASALTRRTVRLILLPAKFIVLQVKLRPLWTLFVAVAILSPPLGYAYHEWNLVQRRAKIIEWLYAQPDADISDADQCIHRPPPIFSSVTNWDALKIRAHDNAAGPSMLRRRFFGDKWITAVALGPSPRPDFCSGDRIKELFPEARIFSLREDDRAGAECAISTEGEGTGAER